MKDDLYFFGGAVVLLVVVVTAIFGLATAITWWSCNDYERITGKPTRYALSGTCYVLDENDWVSGAQYKARNAALHAARELNRSEK